MRTFGEKLFDVLSLSFVSSAISILSIALSLFFALRKEKRKILFTMLGKKTNFLLFIWNASKHTIFMEDIYYFFSYVSKCCSTKVVYKSDSDIQLLIKTDYDEAIYNQLTKTKKGRYTKRINYSFDFLRPNEGYIVRFTCEPTLCNITPITKGRIRGEDHNSVRMFFYPGIISTNSSLNVTKECIPLFITLLNTCLSIILYASDIRLWHFLILAILPIASIIYNRPPIKMPRELKKQYKQSIKQRGYSSIDIFV